MTTTDEISLPRVFFPGDGCPSCYGRIRSSLSEIGGVHSVIGDAQRGVFRLTYDDAQVSLGDVEERIRALGLTLAQKYGHGLWRVRGIDCVDCAQTLQKAIRRTEGVLWAEANIASATLRAEYDPEIVTQQTLEEEIGKLGYDVVPVRGVRATHMYVTGLDCAQCAVNLEKAVGTLEGMVDVKVDFGASRLDYTHEEESGLAELVVRRIEEAGYGVETGSEITQGETPSEAMGRGEWLKEHRRDLTLTVSGFLLVAAFALSRVGISSTYAPVVYALVITLAGLPVVRRGVAALRRARTLDINALMTIAVVGSMVLGEWAEGAVVVFLFSLGNALEAHTMERARRSIRSLMDLAPRRALLIGENEEKWVPVDRLSVGDTILVKPGATIPMDGAIVEGVSTLNQAPITGESLPVDVQVSDPVHAGTINGPGALQIRVTKLVQDNTISRAIQMVAEAQARRAQAQRFVDRFARYYTPGVIALAVTLAVVPPLFLDGAWAEWVRRGLVILVISCPCALVISTPVAIVSAIGSAVRSGVLIKGGVHLEQVAKIKVVAFDKTGTLTVGEPRVAYVVSLDGDSEDEVLSLAASVESRSEHPLAQSIVAEAERRGVAFPPALNARAVVGHGITAEVEGRTVRVGNRSLFDGTNAISPEVEGRLEEIERQGKTAVLVGDPNGVRGVLALADAVRQESRSVVSALRELGIVQTVMLTGDNDVVARAIARDVGVDAYQAELLPEDKVSAIEALGEKYGEVAMVGDGVNDAPALATASVGIAMGAIGTDTALETADIALMGDALGRIPYLVELGRKTMRLIRQNIGLSLAVKFAFLLLSMLGYATLWMAVFADTGISLVVTLNGLRAVTYSYDSDRDG